MNDKISWSINTLTQKQSFFNPPSQRRHGGDLEALLNKVLPSMGRSDIPSHLVSIIKHYGHGVLELPGTQRWDGLRLYYRSDKAELIIDYEAYKSDISITKIKPDGGISIDSVSEMKMPPEWYEEEKVENKELKTGFSKVNELLEISRGIRAGELTTIPNKWLGESEINPESMVDYPSLAGEMDDLIIEDDETALKLRNALRHASDRNNARVGALGEPMGSMDEVIKAKKALADYLGDKPPVKLIVPDAEKIGQLRTINPADITLAVGDVHHSAPRLTMLSNRAPSAEFDGDQIHGPAISPYLRNQWRTRNPAYQEFFKDGREFYDFDAKPIVVLKTSYEDYVLLVKLLRREIYRSEVFLSPALLINALHRYPHIVRADRRTAMQLVKKAYSKCISRYFRTWFRKSIWEYKDMAVRTMMMDGSKREFLSNTPGIFRRAIPASMQYEKTLTCHCRNINPNKE